jgi:hypothetical protein
LYRPNPPPMLSVGATGLVLIGLGALAGFRLALETGVTVIGSLLLAVGHLRNWRLRTRMIQGGGPPCDDVMSHDSAGEKTCASAG